METNICYQLVFIFGKFCEILMHETQNMRFTKVNTSTL